MNPLNVMLIMKHLLAMVYAVCVTSAAFHFGKIAILAWYLLILFIVSTVNVTNKNNRKEG